MRIALPHFFLAARGPSSAGVDLTILGLCLAIGAVFSREKTGTAGYLLGEQKMPGWLVGCFITASTISAMTFLGLPAASFKEDYHWVLPIFTFIAVARDLDLRVEVPGQPAALARAGR